MFDPAGIGFDSDRPDRLLVYGVNAARLGFPLFHNHRRGGVFRNQSSFRLVLCDRVVRLQNAHGEDLSAGKSDPVFWALRAVGLGDRLFSPFAGRHHNPVV